MTTLKELTVKLPPSETPEMLSKINKYFFPEKDRVIQAFIHMRSEFDMDSCGDIIDDILEYNNTSYEFDEDSDSLIENPKVDVINLLITSTGGCMASCFSLINIIKGSKIPVRTIALGEASSAGFCLLMSGHQRVVTPYTSLMSHCFSTANEGTYHDLKNIMEEMDRYNEKMIALYHEMSGMDTELIKKMFLGEKDAFISHDDAIKYNIVDLISDLS